MNSLVTFTIVSDLRLYADLLATFASSFFLSGQIFGRVSRLRLSWSVWRFSLR